MARQAAIDASFIDMLCTAPLPEILSRMPRLPEFEAEYQAYLDKFGDRCLEELKLESPTLHDDPLLLLRSVGQLARRVDLGGGAGEQRNRGAEDKLPITNYQSLIRHPVRRIIFKWVLKTARTLIRNRENLRFERTRLFGRARQIFVQLGHRLHALDLLADPHDIFYLEVEETLGVVEGTATTTDLKGLVAVRKAEFERYRQADPPPGRIETRGIPHQSLKWQVAGGRWQQIKPDVGPGIQNSKFKIQNYLQGLGCSPGIVRGPVRIVTDPTSVALQPGEILVAERTDPGWIMLFPLAAGLLVEHGSLLSHSAIVSREMGLPAIVSVKDVMHQLKDGDWIEFDGSTGVVIKLEGAEN
jgi:pyruvate,water dikinase